MTLPPHWQEPAHLDVRTVNATGFSAVDEILQRRGFQDNGQANAWLNPNLDAEADAAHIPGLGEVVDRIARAVAYNERMLIFGDYDCDGITSTAILFSALSFASENHAHVSWMLPSRDTGYGLRDVQVPRVLEQNPELLILVDCGSNDLETVAAVRAAGIDVVVIDHHQISAQLPDDVLVANPQKSPGSAETIMTAAGLAWLATRMLEQRGNKVCRNGDEGNTRYLDLAMIGTIADVAPLTGINRAIARDGIELLKTARRHGLRSLGREAKFDLQTMRAEDIPFKISSTLNSPGRLGEPDVVLNLLLESNFDRATEQAKDVIALSKKRKALSETVLTAALAAARGHLDDRILVVNGDTWHSGVLGPVATKMAEEFGRPAVVLGGDGEFLTGSGRSVPGWDIAAAFRAVGEFVVHSGGHSAAAGLTVARDQLELFRAAINAYEQDVPFDAAAPMIQLDGEVDFLGLTYGFVDAIERMAPFGRGNPRPLLLWRDVRLAYLKTVGRGGDTVQMEIGKGDVGVKAVLFREAARLGTPRSDQSFDVVVEPSITTWNGRNRVEARLVDFQPSD